MEAQLRLAPAPPAPPGQAEVVLGAADSVGRCLAACTAGGHLHLLPLQPRASCASDTDAFALTLLTDVEPPQLLARPWAAVALLPGGAAGGGLLCAQAGSGRLLFCQHPVAALELGQQGGEAFLLGCHEDPITAIAVSPCGSLALSADAAGALKLWGLADGSPLASVPAACSGGSGAVASACFLPDGAAAAVAWERGSILSVWRPPAVPGGFLELAAELDVGGRGAACSDAGDSSAAPARAVSSVAAAGQLLAVGCSDGTTLLWQHTGGDAFAQHALLPPPAAAAVTALCFSSDASLLAAAAGSAVSILDTCSGELLAQQALPLAPVALAWAASGELLALTSGGMLLPLGAPAPSTGFHEQQASAVPLAAMESAPEMAAMRAPPVPVSGDGALAGGKQRKVVRFAEATQPAVAGAEEGRAASALHQAVASGALASRPALPPLPTHPLLRGSGGGREGGYASLTEPAMMYGGRAPSPEPAARPARLAVGASAAAAKAKAAPAPAVKPLYPILDLRALRGLQAGAPAAAAPPACSPPRSPHKPANQQQHPAISTTRSTQHAGTCTEAGRPAEGCQLGQEQQGRQQPGKAPEPALAMNRQQSVDMQAAAALGQPGVAAVDAAEEEAEPRQARLPAPIMRQQRCQACTMLAPGTAGSSRPSSPAKAALLAQLAALRGEASEGGCDAAFTGAAGQQLGGCGKRGSRPASPLKLGAACTREAQQQGELQPAEIKALTVAELDARLPQVEARRQRYARLSRRCTFARQPGQAAGAGVQPAGHAADAGGLQPAGAGPQQAGQEAGDAHSCLEFHAAAAGSNPSGAAGGAEAAWAGAAGGEDGMDLAALQPPPASDFAVGSDTELTSDEEEEAESSRSLPGDSSPAGEAQEPWAEAAAGAGADVAAAAGSEASADSLSDAASVHPRPHSQHASDSAPTVPAGQRMASLPAQVVMQAGVGAAGSASGMRGANPLGQVAGMLRQLDSRIASLASRTQQHAPTRLPAVVAAAAPRAAPAPAHQLEPDGRRTQPAASTAAPAAPVRLHAQSSTAGNASQAAPLPASALAAPALNSSLLLVHRAELLEKQADAAAGAPLPAEQLEAVRRRAATAATTSQPGARLFGPLPPPDQPASGEGLSPAKAAALAGARKQADERWAGEQAELRPGLEQLWVAEQRVPQRAGLAALAHLVVPLPCGRQLAADFLGLRL